MREDDLTHKIVFHQGPDTVPKFVAEAVRYARRLRVDHPGPHPAMYVRSGGVEYRIPENGMSDVVCGDLVEQINQRS